MIQMPPLTPSRPLRYTTTTTLSADNADPQGGAAEICVPKREMIFIRDNLVAAESARRRGDTAAVYKAYNR